MVFFAPPMFKGVTPLTASYLTLVDGTFGSSVTFSSFGLGAAATGRRIILGVHWREGAVHRSLSSASIGGVSATIHLQSGHSGGSTGFGVAIISAVVPTGTTGDVDLTFSGSVTDTAIAGLRVVDLVNSSPHDTATDENVGSAGSLSDTIDVPANGMAFGVYTSSTNAQNNAVSWSGLADEEYDTNTPGVRISMAWEDGLSAQTGRTISISTSSEPDAGNAFVAVSWV